MNENIIRKNTGYKDYIVVKEKEEVGKEEVRRWRFMDK